MSWLKRIAIFGLVNLLVVLTISLLLNIFHVQPYLTRAGMDYESLLAFCLIWGMGGSFISLALSRMMAKWMMGVEVIEPDTRDPALQQLVQSVHNLARAAGLSVMPEVGFYDSPEVNAFATGPTRNRALVAVSTGLLNKMKLSEVEGVLGHEVAHIANGDMVTMTLIQGVVNAFVMFLSRALAFALDQAMKGGDSRESRRSGPSWTYYLTQFLFEIVFMILGTMVVAWFSRYREFRADAGGARYAGRDKMIAALEALRRTQELATIDAQPAVQALKISNKGSFLRLFSTHPPLEERIARLEMMLG